MGKVVLMVMLTGMEMLKGAHKDLTLMRRKLKQSLMKNMSMVTVQLVMKRQMSSGQLLV